MISLEKQCSSHATRNLIQPVIQRFRVYEQTRHRANSWQLLGLDECKTYNGFFNAINYVQLFFFSFIKHPNLLSCYWYKIQIQQSKTLIPHKERIIQSSY